MSPFRCLLLLYSRQIGSCDSSFQKVIKLFYGGIQINTKVYMEKETCMHIQKNSEKEKIIKGDEPYLPLKHTTKPL